jgi:Zn-finger nucleic acid-binding protein
VIYRDEREQCPRCGAELIDAAAARGCAQCHGLWIDVASVIEMASQMQIPPEPVELPFALDQRPPLACPGCRDPMRTLLLYEVPIDSCIKHGVWFDAQELALVLLRAARKPS